MKKGPIELGKIITFYSFKGGVGRSMSLANTAVLLSQWGYKVLMVDWDLEAPGLENFFKEYLPLEKTGLKPGMIDLLLNATHKNNTDSSESKRYVHWKECLIPIWLNREAKGELHLITAGTLDDLYYEKVRSFDFSNFYAHHDGGNVIENLRKEWTEEYDFVLIDSRTGVTDIGGICTVQLPDILVILFTPTRQSLQGVKRVALKATAAQRKLPYERINLLTLPVPARIDNSEFKLSQQWFETFEIELRELYQSWLPVENKDIEPISLKEFLQNCKIPYISYFSFGETLPVLEEGVYNPTSMGFSYESVAALLATQLNRADLLVNDRTALVKTAKSSTDHTSPDYIKVISKPTDRWLTHYRKMIDAIWGSKIRLIIVVPLLFALMFLVDYINKQNRQKYELQKNALVDSLKLLNTQLSDSLSRRQLIDSLGHRDVSMYLLPGEAALGKARTELSQGAKSIGKKNSGPFVIKYNKIAGLGEGYPWAATFVSWCYEGYFKPSGDIEALQSYFLKKGIDYRLADSQPQPGDIYFYDWKGKRAIGLVESYSSSDYSLYGIEGNSSENSYEAGYKVARVIFDKNELQKLDFLFVRINKKID